uniref:Uncharacterized protein n=1 Tax=Anguilla anguilla TaxID=7936 RepID=A0A0E9XP03_ANGAN
MRSEHFLHKQSFGLLMVTCHHDSRTAALWMIEAVKARALRFDSILLTSMVAVVSLM